VPHSPRATPACRRQRHLSVQRKSGDPLDTAGCAAGRRRAARFFPTQPRHRCGGMASPKQPRPAPRLPRCRQPAHQRAPPGVKSPLPLPSRLFREAAVELQVREINQGRLGPSLGTRQRVPLGGGRGGGGVWHRCFQRRMREARRYRGWTWPTDELVPRRAPTVPADPSLPFRWTGGGRVSENGAEYGADTPGGSAPPSGTSTGSTG